MKSYYWLLAVLFTSIFTNCSQTTETQENSTAGTNLTKVAFAGYAQGTTYSITYFSRNNINYQKEVDSILKAFDMSLSTYKDQSIISRINRNDTSATADDFFRAVFNKSLEISNLTGGAFDFTVAPVVNAWGFGFTEKTEVDARIIDSLLRYVDYRKVQLLRNGKVKKEIPNIQLNVNAIAQGYSVDVIADFLEERGIIHYLVEIGGEVKARGYKPGQQLWRIGIDKPLENSTAQNRELQVILELKNMALATSGNYRQFYEEDGIKYSHTIDPKTGYPVEHNLLSATVIAHDCMTADALATAFMVMGLEKSMNFIEEHPEYKGYFISSDSEGQYKITYSEGVEELIVEESDY